MGGRASRDKGGRGELEIIKLLQPIVTEVMEGLGMVAVDLVKDTRQRYEKKRYDIFGLPWLAIEVKRHEKFTAYNIKQWWNQVKEATKEGQIPMLCWRQNNGAWTVRLRVWVSVVKGGFHPGVGNDVGWVQKPVRVGMTVDVNWEHFIVWFRTQLKYELTQRRI